MRLYGYAWPVLAVLAALVGMAELRASVADEFVREYNAPRYFVAADTTYKTNQRFVYVTDTTLWVQAGWWGSDTSVVPDTSVIEENSFFGITRQRTTGGKMMTLSYTAITGPTALDSAPADDSASLYGMTVAEIQTVALPGAPDDPDPLGMPGSWTLTHQDEFDGTTIDTFKWNLKPPWHPTVINNEAQYYLDVDGNTLVQDNGVLYIIIKDSTANGKDYQSGNISSHNKMDQKYGFFEVRAQLNKSDPLWPAIWLNGDVADGTWPGSGEIDLIEAVNTPKYFHFNQHWDSAGTHLSAGGTWDDDVDRSADWHTYGFYWTDSVMIFLYDGEIISVQDDSASVTDSALYVMANIAACDDGAGGCWSDDVDGGTSFPDTMFVDYVRIWSGTPTALPSLYFELTAEVADTLQDFERVIVAGGNTFDTTSSEAWQGSYSYELDFAGDSVRGYGIRGAGAYENDAWFQVAFKLSSDFSMPAWEYFKIISVGPGGDCWPTGWCGTSVDYQMYNEGGTLVLAMSAFEDDLGGGYEQVDVIDPVSTDTWYVITTNWVADASAGGWQVYVDSTLASDSLTLNTEGGQADKSLTGGIPASSNQGITGSIFYDGIKSGAELAIP